MLLHERPQLHRFCSYGWLIMGVIFDHPIEQNHTGVQTCGPRHYLLQPMTHFSSPSFMDVPGKSMAPFVSLKHLVIGPDVSTKPVEVIPCKAQPSYADVSIICRCFQDFKFPIPTCSKVGLEGESPSPEAPPAGSRSLDEKLASMLHMLRGLIRGWNSGIFRESIFGATSRRVQILRGKRFSWGSTGCEL